MLTTGCGMAPPAAAQAAEGSPSVSYMATTTTARLQPPAAAATPPGTAAAAGAAAAKDEVVSTTGIPVRPSARPTQRLPSLVRARTPTWSDAPDAPAHACVRNRVGWGGGPASRRRTGSARPCRRTSSRALSRACGRPLRAASSRRGSRRGRPGRTFAATWTGRSSACSSQRPRSRTPSSTPSGPSGSRGHAARSSLAAAGTCLTGALNRRRWRGRLAGARG